jgi:hypothetical protein
MEKVPYTVEVIEDLRWNSHLSKRGHFYASQKWLRLHMVSGILIVIINLTLSALFFVVLESEVSEWSKWIGAALALTAALLGGVQTFFSFKKSYEGHRKVGNEYLAIAIECERLIALYFDRVLDLGQLSNEIESLNTKYSLINQKAEGFMVSDKTYNRALEVQKGKAVEDPSLVQIKYSTVAS